MSDRTNDGGSVMSNSGAILAQNYDLAESIDPRLVPVNAPKGTIYRYIPSIGAPEILVKQDDGSSTNYVVLGGGGGGGANTTLSNLTSPTNINQDLLQAAGKSIGSTLLPWFKVIANEGHFTLLRNSTDTKTIINLDNSQLNATGAPYSGPVIDWNDGNLNVPSKPNDSDNPRELRLFKGTFYVSVRAPLLTANTVFQYPLNNGSSGQVLTTDGNGITSWTTVGGGGANTTLSNLTAPTAFNQDFLPDNTDTRSIGSAVKRIAVIESLQTNTDIISKSTSGGFGIRIDMTLGYLYSSAPSGPTVPVMSWGDGAITIFPTNADTRRDFKLFGKFQFPATRYYTNILASNTLTADTLFQLPNSNGTSGQVLTTDGAGITSWTTVGGSGANTTLSNLSSPTAINRSLLPAASNLYSLGILGQTWTELYVGNVILTGDGFTNALGTQTFLSLTSRSLFSTTGEIIKWSNSGLDILVETIPIRWFDGNSPFYKTTLLPSSTPTDEVLFRLPPNNGTNAQRLATDGTGITSWTNKTVIEGGNTASRPASPITYENYFDTTLNIPIWYNGTNWVDATGTTV